MFQICTWLILIWFGSFWAGFAYGQDCTYINNIVHDTNGDVVSSTTEYVCKTPPKVVEVHTYPNKDAHDVMSSKIYGLPLNSYENPEQVLYNIQVDLMLAEQKAANISSLLSIFGFNQE